MKCQCICGCNRPYEPAYTGGEEICWKCRAGVHIGVKLEDGDWR